MDETTDVDVFEDRGVLMLRYPDGSVEAYDDYLRRTEPGMQYDNATGELIVATPPTAEAAARPAAGLAPDVFGDTTMEMASPYFRDAADLAANAGRRPTYFEQPFMQGLERTGQYVGDMGLAGLNAIMGGMYGGAGLLGEAFGGDRQGERSLARDLAGMIDVAGPAPEERMLGLLTDAAMAGRVPGSRAEFLAGESGAVPVPFGENWSDVYHWSRSPEGFSEFDPNASTSVMSQLGPHVGTKQAAEARYMGFAKPDGTPPPLGFTMPLKADLQRPFMNPATGEPWSEMDLEMFISAVADEQGIDRRSIAPLMRQKIAEQGYTSIPYRNDVEDAGSLSHIMMTEGRPGDAVLRSRFAGFDPSKRNLKDLSASLAAAGVPLGLLAMQPEEDQY